MKAPAMESPAERSEHIHPSGLNGIRLRFHLLATTPLQLSAYKGSTFHGAFGWALRGLYRPLYDLLYEPASTMLPAGETARMALPKPFVLVPPLGTQCEYPPGSRLSCELLLIGPACYSLTACLCAFEHIGREGLGPARGRFELERVERLVPGGASHLLLEQGRSAVMHPGPPTTSQEVIRGWADRDIDQVTLSFETRLRLKHDNRLVRTCPEFATFLERVIARINLLSGAYHGGPMLEHPAKPAVLDQAKRVNVRGHDLVWDDWARYSGRQKEWMRFGGLLGSATYEGNLKPLMPWLALGEWLHVGGKTSFGLGRYKMTCVSA
ncbi:MAG: CRISPR system precrRNA processing endoribonuclease RAMP protein Cas6 [Gammaproteobacteria bacterium]